MDQGTSAGHLWRRFHRYGAAICQRCGQPKTRSARQCKAVVKPPADPATN